MAKKSLFLLLFGVFQIINNPVFADEALINPENKSHQTVECTAPAPDSFYVTNRGPNYISVAWNPAWVGAAHTLAVFTRIDSTYDWVLVDSFFNVTGTALIVTGVALELECKMVIATNCPSAIPSIYSKSLLDKIIVQLDISGRVPVNPVPIDCENLPLPTPQFNWIGFQVIQGNGGAASKNTFEVVVTYPNIWTTMVGVKRVHEANDLVAAKLNGEVPPPPLTEGAIFKIIKIIPNSLPYTIGRLMVVKNGNSINLCKDPAINWDPTYSFIPMKAGAPWGFASDPFAESKYDIENVSISNLQVQSPFNETLSVSVHAQTQTEGNGIIRLISTSGQIVLIQQFKYPVEQLTIPATLLPSGLYILQVETDTEAHVLKIVKGQ
ncbi:MAG: T9SS type A sorting domain-containing protein [Saprospiraceae bacterium]